MTLEEMKVQIDDILMSYDATVDSEIAPLVKRENAMTEWSVVNNLYNSLSDASSGLNELINFKRRNERV